MKTAREIIETYDGPHVRIMEVCGTHTHEIFRLGIRKLLPEQVELISGPGCPVCVTPVSFIDEAIYLALEKGVTVCTFGDLVRVPGTKMSLAGAREQGAKIRIVYSPADAEKYAREQMRTSNIMNKVWSNFVASCEVVSYSSTEKESLKKVADANYESQLQSQYGVDLDSYLEAASMSKEDWDNNIMSQVESSLKTKMVYQALAKKADLVPSDSDYNKEAETLAQQNSLSVKELESTYGKTEVEYAVITQRVQKYIAENVTVKEGSEPTTAAETTEAATTAK
mgnify:CR=1 FL=1